MKTDAVPKGVKQALTTYRKTLDMDTLTLTVSNEIEGMNPEQQRAILMWLSWNLADV